MKRLIHETFAPGTPEERLVRLVRASPRCEPEPFAKPRVLARVMLAQSRKRGVWPRSLASILVFGGTAMAAAAVGNQIWIAHQVAQAVPEISGPTEQPAPPPRAAEATTVPAPSVAQVVPAPALDGPSHQAPSARPSVANGAHRVGGEPSRLRLAPKGPGVAGAKGVRISEADREDPAQVLEAIRSLRTDGNAVLASVFLDEYLMDHPRGILAEDALALSIEAANARRDRRSAGDYAERYLRQYPAGRFRPLAEDALGRRGQ